MVRYAFALRGKAIDTDHEIRLEEQPVDIMKNEQLSKEFLCNINANGEVPVLKPLNSGPPLPDSVAITKFLASSYPSMIPKPHEREVIELMEDLHTISFFGFTFAGKPQGLSASRSYLNSLLEGNISDQYRAAILTKLKRLETKKSSALTPEAQEANEQHTRQIMARIEALLQESKSGYFFGLEQPSALDAHVVVFIARMLDIGRQDVIPQMVKSYGNKAMEGAEWHQVMQGRTTSPLKVL